MMGLRSIFVCVLLMVMVLHFSVCDKNFGWEEGDPCEDIPFPFGIRGTALSGFELKCQDGKATLLPSNNQSYPILSIWNSYVIVSTGILYKRCFNHDGSQTIKNNSALLNFEGTPYSISDETELVLFGCDDSMTVKYVDSAELSKCNVSCNGSADFNQTSMCRGGLNCCIATLPQSSDYGGGKSVHLEFSHNKNSTSDGSFDEFAHCSIAYVVGDGSIDFKHPNDPYNGSQVELYWTIGDLPCEEARHQPDYRCKSNYSCSKPSVGQPYTSREHQITQFPSLIGYNCFCDDGFQGNPYLPGGCSGTYYLKLILSLKAYIS
jgi:hypothetical protein